MPTFLSINLKTTMFFLLLQSAVVLTKAQQIKGFIKEYKTGKPVPFASIQNIEKKTGTYADSTGLFILNGHIGDSLQVSSIGYDSKKIQVSNAQEILIELSAKSINISEVRIYNNSTEEKVGLFDLKKTTYIGLPFGDEIAVLIKNNWGEDKNIVKVNFNLDKDRKYETGFLRLHVYSVDILQNIPNFDLLGEPITVTLQNYDPKKGIDIEKYNIILPPEGVFIAFEWLKFNYLSKNNKSSIIAMNPCVKGTYQSMESLSYRRRNLIGLNWEKITREHDFSTLVNQTNPLNIAIGLVVK